MTKKARLRHKLVFISAPDHGWLEVPLVELGALGIANEISSCSFVNGRMVYLEEDADATVYLNARRAQGHPAPELENRYVNHFDRSQKPYEPPPPKLTVAELEEALRALWDAQGVSPEKQEEILDDVAQKVADPTFNQTFQPQPSSAPPPSLYVCYAEHTFTVPQEMAEADREMMVTAVETFCYLLNTSELRRKRVSYLEFAHLIRKASSHERSRLYAETLERLSGWQKVEFGVGGELAPVAVDGGELARSGRIN